MLKIINFSGILLKEMSSLSDKNLALSGFVWIAMSHYVKTLHFIPVKGLFRKEKREVRRIDVNRCIKILDIDARNDAILYKTPLFPLLDRIWVSLCFNQEASSILMPRVNMGNLPKTVCNTPPQVDTSALRNIAAQNKKKRSHALLALLRTFIIFSLLPAQPVFGNEQRKLGDKSKSGKKQSDTGKSKPARQGNREQQDQQKPKTKG